MNYCKHANFCTQCPLLRGDSSSCGSHKGVLVTDHKNTKNGKDIVWVCNDGRWDWEEINTFCSKRCYPNCCPSCSTAKGLIVTNEIKTIGSTKFVLICKNGEWDWVEIVSWEEIEEKRYECNNECPKYRVIDGKKCVFVCGSWKEIKCPFLTCCRSCCGTCPRT